MRQFEWLSLCQPFKKAINAIFSFFLKNTNIKSTRFKKSPWILSVTLGEFEYKKYIKNSLCIHRNVRTRSMSGKEQSNSLLAFWGLFLLFRIIWNVLEFMWYTRQWHKGFIYIIYLSLDPIFNCLYKHTLRLIEF